MSFKGYLKQSTAADVLAGPYLDDSDGNADETGLTITPADVRLSKNSGNMAAKNEGTSLVHDELGMYVCKFDATDTDTVGFLDLIVHEAGALTVVHTWQVLEEAIYDDMFGTGAALAKAAALATVDTEVGVIDGIVDNILIDTADMQPRVVAIEIDTETTLQGELDGIQADTEDIQSRIPASLVDGRIDANAGAISGDATAADNLELQYDGTGLSGVNFPGTQGQVLDNKALTESQRSDHTVQGSVFYVDPTNGRTVGAGGTGDVFDPISTVQDCHDNLVTDSAHDCIILVAGAAGLTTLTEAVTLSKRYLQIRGPGRDFLWTRSGAGDTIAITADGIGLQGFRCETDTTGTGAGVQATDADFILIDEVWFNNTRGDGVDLLRCENSIIEDNIFTNTGTSGSGEGVHIRGTGPGVASYNIIRNNLFRNVAGTGILIEDGTTNDTTIRLNQIEGAGAWGISIGASSVDAIVTENRLGNNASGDIQDNGTTSVIQNNYDVWDVAVASHAAAGSFGKAVADTEADATTILTDTADMQPKLGIPSTDLAADIAAVPTVSEIIVALAPEVRYNTAQGGAATTITLDTGANVNDDYYNGALIFIIGGTGASDPPQVRVITDYVGGSKVATVATWGTNPDATSIFLILGLN